NSTPALPGLWRALAGAFAKTRSRHAGLATTASILRISCAIFSRSELATKTGTAATCNALARVAGCCGHRHSVFRRSAGMSCCAEQSHWLSVWMLIRNSRVDQRVLLIFDPAQLTTRIIDQHNRGDDDAGVVHFQGAGHAQRAL